MIRLIDADALERDGWQMSRTVRINKDTMELQIRKPTDFHAIKDEPTIEPERWIPVTERLPEKSEFYLVTVNDGAFYTDLSFWKGKEFVEHTGDVVAWMPLPEPYKERREE